MKNTPKDKDHFYARWLAGELSEDELATFKKTKEYHLYDKIAYTTATFKVPAVDVQEKLKKQIAHNKQQQPKEGKNVKNLIWRVAAIIAVVLCTIIYANRSQDITIDYAQNKIHSLPDGSSITLNAGSSIAYDPTSFLETRLVNLKGEAYFKVQKGSSFTVISPSGSVTVLGTAFNIYDRDHVLKVHCSEGKVKVKVKDSEIILTKGMSALSLEQSTLQRDSLVPTWQTGKTTFKDTALREVFDEIERQFSITIKTSEIDLTRKFTGFFTYEDLNTALYQVCTPMNIKYDIQGSTINLKK